MGWIGSYEKDFEMLDVSIIVVNWNAGHQLLVVLNLSVVVLILKKLKLSLLITLLDLNACQAQVMLVK